MDDATLRQYLADDPPTIVSTSKKSSIGEGRRCLEAATY